MRTLPCIIFATSVLAASACADAVTLKNDGGTWTIHASKYDAIVEPDGCMSHLSVNGQDYLRPGVSISRGSYFFQGGALQLRISRADGNILVATGDRAVVRYEFDDEKLKLSVSNSTDSPLRFLLVIDSAIKGCINDRGETASVPTNAAWTQTIWIQDKSKLQVSGSNKLWGPWEHLQVWEADLAAHESRDLLFVPGTPTADELKAVAALPASPGETPTGEVIAEQDLTVLSPHEYEVVQRQSAAEGRLHVSGRVKANIDAVEVHVIGKSSDLADLPDTWQPVPMVAATHAFDGDIHLPAGGWYKVELRATLSHSPIAQAVVEHVGIGEVFVGAGQSNSTNYGEVRQTPASGMVATFNGAAWRLAADPQPGAHDNSTGGSFWPAFGDALYSKYHVPIGVAVTGHGGTSVRQWNVEGPLFAWTLARMKDLGRDGFRAVLWHQGESDRKMPADEYAQRLTQVIWASKQASGWEFPWFVAHASYLNAAESSDATVRDGQKLLWDRGVALEGPDTDLLAAEYREHAGKGVHFNASGLKAHGEAWARKVSHYLDLVLK